MMLKIRSATVEDCRLLWEWANDPEVRANSFHSEYIPWDKHIAWFNKKMKDPNCHLYLITEENSEPIGQLRFSVIEDSRSVVSISIAKDKRGYGHGTEGLLSALEALSKETAAKEVVAYVKPDNVSSIRMFEKAGFVNQGPRVVEGQNALAFLWVYKTNKANWFYQDSTHSLTQPNRIMDSKWFQSTPHQTVFHVLFRVDAGLGAGLGHLRRSLSLAAALRQHGATCTFLTSGDKIVHNLVESAGWDMEVSTMSGDSEDMKQVLGSARGCGGNVVVVDSYKVDIGYLLGIRKAGLYTVVLDDLARFPFPSQLVINASALASRLPYISSTGDTRFLLGTEYALLAPEFWNVHIRSVHEEVDQVLATLGGEDQNNLMPGLLDLLQDLPGEFDVTAIVGPFFRNRAQIEAAMSNCRRRVKLVEVGTSIRDLMLESDMAVSGGGQTLYELAATGTPTVAIQIADNQNINLQGLADQGVLRLGGRIGDPGLVKTLRRELSDMVQNVAIRKEMSAAGQRAVDGQGALRVAKAMAESVASKPCA
jgi:UDP-2,4-diacetamido-2,4,6-trideoxy-beta-L-altropyranose hydrolase